MQVNDSIITHPVVNNSAVPISLGASAILPVSNIKTKLSSIDSFPQKPIDSLYLKCSNIADWPEMLSIKHPFNEIRTNKQLFSSGIKVDSYIEKNNLKYEPHNVIYGFGIINLFIVLLFLGLILIAWTRIAFSKYLNQILRALFNYSDAYKLFRDHNTVLDRVYVILNIVFIFSGGIFSFHLFEYFAPKALNINFYIVLLAGASIILVIFFSRYILLKIVGAILNQFQLFNEYMHNTFLYFKIAGIALLPVSAVISFIQLSYRPMFLYFGLFIILLIYFISILRGTRIMRQKGILLFYWILYLCTVEFLPILLLYKYISTLL